MFSMNKTRNQVRTRFKGPKFRPTFIKQWRKHRGLTQEQLADRVEMTGGNLSEIENGNTGYTQATLEALAVALQCEVVDLLTRDPGDPEGIWTLWDKVKDDQKKQVIGIIEGFLKASKAA